MNKIQSLLPPVARAEDLSFVTWYASYPKKTEKRLAEQRWNKLSDDDKRRAIVDVPVRISEHDQWQNKVMIPNPARYLLNRMWQDDIVKAQTVEDKQQAEEDGSNLGRLWTLLKQLYGYERWVKQYGKAPPFMWGKRLHDITPREVAHIITRLETDSAGYLPGMLPDLVMIVRIRKSCQPPNLYMSLPRPKTNPVTVASEIEKMRAILK